MSNDLPYVEFRFKRDWETRRAGWVQGRSHASGSWFPMKYCRNVKAADRYVRRVITRRGEPVMYIDLPIQIGIK
jgi:hypothetical protein